MFKIQEFDLRSSQGIGIPGLLHPQKDVNLRGEDIRNYRFCEEIIFLSLSKFMIFVTFLRIKYFDSDGKLISSQNLYFRMTAVST